MADPQESEKNAKMHRGFVSNLSATKLALLRVSVKPSQIKVMIRFFKLKNPFSNLENLKLLFNRFAKTAQIASDLEAIDQQILLLV